MDNPELESLLERVLTKKDQLEREGLRIEDKELIRETIAEKIEDSLKNYPPLEQKQAATSFSPARSLPQAEDEEEIQHKINDLVEIAFQKGVEKAVTLALKSGNAYLIDKIHDILVDKYYNKLKEEKLI